MGTFRRLLALRREIDIIHAQQAHIQTVAAIVAGRIAGRGVVTTLHVLVPRPRDKLRVRILSLIERFTLRRSDEVVFVSHHTKETFRSRRGIVIHNGVDTTRFAPDEGARSRQREVLGLGEEVLVLYLGRWAEIKGIREMLEVISKVCASGDRRVRFALVGGGREDERAFVMREVARRSLDKCVTLVWGVRPDPIPWLQAADVFILPSHDEGLPLSLLEAMSMALPCIVTPVGGVPEVVEDGTDALVVPALDSGEMYKAVMTCVGDLGLRRHLGANARRKAVGRFGLGRMAEDYRRVYETLSRQVGCPNTAHKALPGVVDVDED